MHIRARGVHTRSCIYGNRSAQGTALLAFALLLFCAPCTRARGNEEELAFLNQTIPALGTAAWATCGYYGIDYSIRCTANITAWVSPRAACAPGLGPGPLPSQPADNCPVLAEYADLTCSGLWCVRAAFRPNDVSFCLLVASDTARNSNTSGAAPRCDIRVAARATAIPEPARLKWPVWQIVAVSVGGGVGVFILAMLCCLFVYLQHMNNAAVTPSAQGDEDDPNAFGAKAAGPEVGARDYARNPYDDTAGAPMLAPWQRGVVGTPLLPGTAGAAPYGSPGARVMAPYETALQPAGWPVHAPSPRGKAGQLEPLSGIMTFPPAYHSPQQRPTGLY